MKKRQKKKSRKTSKAKKFIKNPKAFIISLSLVILTAVIGSLFTATGSWYESVKPAITPPNYVFPIAWTILFVLIALSMYFALSNSAGKQRRNITILFASNLVLNVLWSLFFFGMHNPALAFADLILLWLSILGLIQTTWKVSNKSAWLLLPYVLWVTFAGLLNYLILMSIR